MRAHLPAGHTACRWLLRVLLLLAPTGCSAVAAGAVAGADLPSVIVFGRALPDLVVSAITGLDCSVVRLEQGRTYCAPIQPPPAAPPFCTRTLGVVECWADPTLLADAPRGVADGPARLTPAQEADRTRRWPGLF